MQERNYVTFAHLQEFMRNATWFVSNERQNSVENNYQAQPIWHYPPRFSIIRFDRISRRSMLFYSML